MFGGICGVSSIHSFYYLNKSNVVHSTAYTRSRTLCKHHKTVVRWHFVFIALFIVYAYVLLFVRFYRLHDSETKAIVTRYEVSRIIFYFRGPPGSADQACFAFTFQTGETNDLNPLFQCYIFRCNIPEAVAQVSSKLCDFR